MYVLVLVLVLVLVIMNQIENNYNNKLYIQEEMQVIFTGMCLINNIELKA